MVKPSVILLFLCAFWTFPSGAQPAAGKQTIQVLWYESRPFVYRDARGRMQGIEYEIMTGFADFLKQRHRIDLTIQWSEAASFAGVYEQVRTSGKGSLFGVSAFSITQERREHVAFSPPYMSDISVLITSDDVPLISSWEEFYRMAGTLTAVTIHGTTYEYTLNKLKEEGRFAYQFKYIPSSENIIREVEKSRLSFGFIDLPVYMMMFNNNPGIRIKRQNLFPVRREGYGIIFPLGSEWTDLVNAYFADEVFRQRLEQIKARYTDIELFQLMERLASSSADPVELLAKEREIQSRELQLKSEQIATEGIIRTYLILLIAVALVSLVIIVALYRKSENRKAQIDLQRAELELRNQHLTELDEQKNNLIKILAHDLRSPINHVEGLSQLLLLGKDPLTEEQRQMLQTVTDSSSRLNKMIANILDTDALDSHRLRMFLEVVDMAPMLKGVMRSFEEPARRKGIRLVLEAPTEPVKAMADPLFIIQVFENLVSNAVKFSPPNTTITVGLRTDGSAVATEVRDQGPGISEDDRPNLFKKYQRLSARPTGGESSTGLGLAIVKNYVELMNGKVWCEPGLEGGTSFLVSLPRA